VQLILASTSPWRRELLTRLGLAFSIDRPQVDEAPLPGETADALARRLSRAKALAVSIRHPRAVVIGSDQVCVADGLLLGKPGTADAACAQLARLAAREAQFLTGVCVARDGIALHDALVPTAVRMRALSSEEITRYVQRERPLDCAGSFKVEGLGIALFESVRSDDPTALIGLPLIETCAGLRRAGLDPLG
jgi:septum formation protein